MVWPFAFKKPKPPPVYLALLCLVEEREELRDAIQLHLSARGACVYAEGCCVRCHMEGCTYCALATAVGQGGCSDDCPREG
jgi:hypothetical protein